ncbi:GTP-binding protein [Fonticella tunisiensis]|uniref:Hydrogenase accessory protein HypB n=1 Tax=Fonticella tunisiensis TaxID=1096341 RepID=A0A4R7KR77_9CLOT|nr:GTP-binding protein [Fonticella tunisiensis]TDT61871.1 hydrogenase accessory protein HypB [Fonticella tunisiensis]
MITSLFYSNYGHIIYVAALCPAEFNIGEDIRVAILSVPEGDDKLEKYPLMFTTSESIVINKYDMIKYFDFDDVRLENTAKEMNPNIRVFRVSSTKETGIDELVEWLEGNINEKIQNLVTQLEH